ncbi:hypothetical protein SynBIOSE41_03902 [Synechococcus sp. BIOS-E4-1]|nr:hypothetical protein SynBIOSE41_03902 [Synechococcus sp. BIOS-E4-1]
MMRELINGDFRNEAIFINFNYSVHLNHSFIWFYFCFFLQSLFESSSNGVY